MADEAGIVGAWRQDLVPDWAGTVANETAAARERYFNRLADLLPEGALSGLRIGVFEHSTVARDLLTRTLRHFGAETVALDRREAFVAVDTESFGDAVFAPLAEWVTLYALDEIQDTSSSPTCRC